MSTVVASPAELEAKAVQERIHATVRERHHFLVEAGAGAGKTESLVATLEYLIRHEGKRLIQGRQQVACITFTNTATNEILARIDRHPAIYCSTIHAFCWMLVSGFQPQLREFVNSAPAWAERLGEAGLTDIGSCAVSYNLGYRSVDTGEVLLHHDDVVEFTATLLARAKFRKILAARFPVILIDEYQDTSASIVHALVNHVLPERDGTVIGFFGDHWQKIYDGGCGAIASSHLTLINKGANFRSAPEIVTLLNRLRPALRQQVHHTDRSGAIALYHTNSFSGVRRKGAHWDGDLPEDQVDVYFNRAKQDLQSHGWNLSSEHTRILMLTHRGIAVRQGYDGITAAFEGHNDAYIKREDPTMAFLIDVVEPFWRAYEAGAIGQMFDIIGHDDVPIRTTGDKLNWRRDMERLGEARRTGTIQNVIELLSRTRRPKPTEAVQKRLSEIASPVVPADEHVVNRARRLSNVLAVPYRQLVALWEFVNEHTPFATKHSVKGRQFENVLVVVGRGWSHYNFDKLFSWSANIDRVRHDEVESYERNRNLWYVACSRPTHRLAVLVTQRLSPPSFSMLERWFGANAIHAL